jgi:hypothetical protein
VILIPLAESLSGHPAALTAAGLTVLTLALAIAKTHRSSGG